MNTSSKIMKKVHVLLNKNEINPMIQALQKKGQPGYEFVPLSPEPGSDDLTDGQLKELRSARILLTSAGQLGRLLYSLPSLQWAQLTFAGVDQLMPFYKPDQPEPRFAVTRQASEQFARELAEWVLTAVLCYERRFPLMFRAQQQRIWTSSDKFPYRPLNRLNIGVMGTGQMGTQVGVVFKSLGSTVHGLCRTPSKHQAGQVFDKIYGVDQLLEFLQSADYICNLLPSTASSRHLLTAALLSQLPRTPVLVNAGRGDVISQAQLTTALQNGWLAGAVLDVFETEPLPADSPLWSMEQVVISPHVGNLSRPDTVADMFLENLGRFQRSEPLLYRVDWQAGY